MLFIFSPFQKCINTVERVLRTFGNCSRSLIFEIKLWKGVYVDGYAFFHVHLSTKSQENPKGPKFSIFKFQLSGKKCVCSIALAG